MNTQGRVEAAGHLRPAPLEAVDEGDVIDLRRLFGTVWRRKSTIIFTTLLCLATAFVILQQMTERYTASAQVMLNTRETNVVDVESVISGLPADSKLVEGEIAIINSNQLLARVVEKLRLDRDREFNPALQPISFLSEWASGAKDALPEDLRLMMGMVPEAPQDDALMAEAERLEIIETLRKAVSARQRGLSVVIGISVKSESPRKAALIANQIADQYLVDQLEAKFEATRRASAWLNERVADLKAKVETAEQAVEDYREAQKIEGGQSADVTTQQLGELNTQLIAAKSVLAEARARFGQVQSIINQRGLAAAGDVLSSPLILTLRTEVAELARRETELAQTYGDRHPTMINARAELSDARNAVAAEVRKIVTGLQNDVGVAQARVSTLESSLGELETQATRISKSSVQLRQLEREADANRLIYENFLTRFKETSEQEEIQQADARIISAAQPPRNPSEPKKPLIMAVAGVLGMMMGLGLVFLIETLNNTFRTAVELEERAGLPVLASLPRFGRRKRRSQVLTYIRQKPSSALAEAIRTLRTAVLLSNIDTPPKTLMLTSSLPAEGKSTTGMLLAYLSTQMGKSAIIVDCDIRRPTLYHTFGLDEGPDIISVLDGSAELDDVIHEDPETGLHVLPTIRSASQAADILSSQSFAKLVEELRARYDLVLLDTPPILLVSDAAVVGKYADAAIYVVQWDKTAREAAVQGMRQLVEMGVNLSGTVLSLVDRAQEAKYAYYNYGHGYGTYAGKNAYYSD
ncbi:MAG: polysaccharide biosynthesis tyrosine autokinase [Pseudomonadota bacterium]